MYSDSARVLFAPPSWGAQGMCHPRASPHEGLKRFSLTVKIETNGNEETGPQRLHLWPRPIALDTWGGGKVTVIRL